MNVTSPTVPSKPGGSGIMFLLSAMMFLQFFAWGAWFATLSAAMSANLLGEFIGGAYEAAPIAAIFAPLFLGLIADRWFSSEKVMGVLMLVGACIMAAIPRVAATPEMGNIFVWLILAYMLCYMPTLGLGNTIAFTHIPSQQDFPKIRVWGTIGWIVAGLVLGVLGWSATFNIFWLGAGSSALLGVLCFFLPNTPPPLKGKPLDARSLLMVDAFALFKDFNFMVFAVCSTLICIPLAYYYGQTSAFLTHAGFVEAGATMTIGQMSEIIFMLLIPFFFRRLGVKVMIMIGMACWVLRYLLFGLGAPEHVGWMLLLAVALHGICYDFFFVTGFMYTDHKASKEIRGQAQGLLVFLTQGIGMFFGFRIMAGAEFLGIPLNFQVGEYGARLPATVTDPVSDAFATARQGESVGFVEAFSRMFSQDIPESVDQGMLSNVLDQWGNFWIFPGIMAAVVLVIFTLSFWDKMNVDEVE